MGGWMAARQWRQLLAYILAENHPNGVEVPEAVLALLDGPEEVYELQSSDSITRSSTILSGRRVSRS